MTELALLQRKMNAIEKATDLETQKVLHGCVVMLNNGGHPKAVAAYLQMAVHFYGKQRIASALESPQFYVLKNYMR